MEHWDFEDLLQVFRSQGVSDPKAWLTLWSFFEGVPKFYRDAHNFKVLEGPAAEMGRRILERLFLDGSSPLKDEAENWFLRELHGRAVSIIRFLAANPGGHAGDIAAALTKDGNSAELGSYLNTLVSRYKMVEKRLPVFARASNRSARYYLTDNFLQSCLAVTMPAMHMARIRPVERALVDALPRLFTHEGHAFEKLIRALHVECSRKGKGDFSVGSMQLGYWNKPRDMSRSIELDVVAFDEESKVVRFGSCKRAASAHDAPSLNRFSAQIGAFLETKEGRRLQSWRRELALFSPVFGDDERARLQAQGFICRDLPVFAAFLEE